MKTYALLLAGITVAVITTGCSTTNTNISQNKIEKEAQCYNTMPEDIRNATVANGFAAIGRAQYTKAGPAYMIPIAEIEAEKELAKHVTSEITSLGNVSKELTKTEEIDQYNTNFREITESFVKRNIITGAKTIKTYQNPCRGDMYVKKAISYSDLVSKYEAQKDTYKQTLEKMGVTRTVLDAGMKAIDKNIQTLREREKLQ
jgi:hypothetical protein